MNKSVQNTIEENLGSPKRLDSPRAANIKQRIQDLEERITLQRTEYDQLLDRVEQIEVKQVFF